MSTAPVTCSWCSLTSESLSAAAGFARRFGAARLATHCLETQPRWRKVRAEFGRSTVQVFAQAGLLHQGTVLYHCVHTDEADLQARCQRRRARALSSVQLVRRGY